MANKIKLYPNKIVTIICGISLALTLTGCNENSAEIKNTETSSLETSPEEEILNTKKENDSAAEAAIELMIEEGNKLKESAANAANDEHVQEELDRSMQNLKDLTDFVFNGSEINGVTFNDLSEEGKQDAINALNSLDDTINYLVPNYKERFKDWFTDSAAKGLDALENLKDKSLDLWNEIENKRHSK